MKRKQLSFPILRFAAAAFVAASTTVHAATTASDGGAEAPNNNTGAANPSTQKNAVPVSSVIPKSMPSPVQPDPSPRTLVGQSSQPRDRRPEVSQGAHAESEPEESEDDGLWENESGIVYGGFGWKHDKRGGEGGGGGSRGPGSYGGPGAIVVLPPPFLHGGHYPKTSSGASRPRPFGFLRS
ncbi:uncharacterized protein PG986_007285 [Apiospora aurea]|uniref:Secreted protein n=1 Tax=Apiospora aurea TaxID=335848 RepID=A0ABR1QCF3_9PEZI